MAETIVAASAAPGIVTPAPVVTPPPAAPSAAPAKPTPGPSQEGRALTLADFDKLASDSLRANAAPIAPSTTAEPPAVAPGQESPPVEPAPELQTTEPTPNPSAGGEPAGEDEDEPSAEVQSTWSEGERKLHGALVKERTARKEARAELKEFKTKLAEIEAKLTNPQTPPAAPSEPTAPAPVTTPSVAAPALVDCQTFEAIDARVMQAAAAESAALRLQQTLYSRGLDAVLPQLARHGVVVQDGNLVDVASKTVLGEATDETVGDFIANVFDGAKQVQSQAEPRKDWLRTQGRAWAEAVKIMPKLADDKSEDFKRIAHFVRGNPVLQARADWPVLAVKLYLGEQAWSSKLAPSVPATTVPVKPPVIPPAPRSAPGAPRTSAAALPKGNELTELRAKMAAGTATLGEVDRLASLSLQENAVA